MMVTAIGQMHWTNTIRLTLQYTLIIHGTRRMRRSSFRRLQATSLLMGAESILLLLIVEIVVRKWWLRLSKCIEQTTWGSPCNIHWSFMLELEGCAPTVVNIIVVDGGGVDCVVVVDRKNCGLCAWGRGHAKLTPRRFGYVYVDNE